MTLTPAGSGRVTLAATTVTSAPRATAVRASAYPCVPVDQLPMNRTGLISSLVPPAETTTRRPFRSCGAPASRWTATAKISAGSGSRPGPLSVPVQPADGGVEHDGPAAAQQRHVRLGRGVLPHLGVHGRRVQDRAPGGQQRGGQQVPGHPGRGAGHQVGGRGGDQDEIGGLAQPDVRHLGDAGPGVGRDRLAGQRGPGRLADETERVGGRDDPDAVTGFGEQPEELAALVRRDACADAEDDAGRHARTRLPGLSGQPSVVSTVSRCSLISRSEMDSGFSWLRVSTSGPTYSSSPSPSCE